MRGPDNLVQVSPDLPDDLVLAVFDLDLERLRRLEDLMGWTGRSESGEAAAGSFSKEERSPAQANTRAGRTTRRKRGNSRRGAFGTSL